jgi:hypothetical protein
MNQIKINTPQYIDKTFIPADFPRGQFGIIVSWDMHEQYVGQAVFRVKTTNCVPVKDVLALLKDGEAWIDIGKSGPINDGSCKIRLLRQGEKIEIIGS